MRKLIYISCSIILFFGCNSTPEFTKEAIQGNWVCFDFTMKGETIDSTLEKNSKEVTIKTLHTFIGDTLFLKNEYFTLGFVCDYKCKEKQIICTPIGFNDVTARTFDVIDFTGDVLVLQENIFGIISNLYLQKEKK